MQIPQNTHLFEFGFEWQNRLDPRRQQVRFAKWPIVTKSEAIFALLSANLQGREVQ
jgi:hypothetical protein